MRFGMKLVRLALFFLFIFSLLVSQFHGAEVYNITLSHPLSVGQTLVSPSKTFELGFFRPNSSASKYVGLWHKNIFPRKYVWVANRDNPLAVADTAATLRISSGGNLEVVDGKQSFIWSTGISNSAYAILTDDGNFVVKGATGAVMWESFTDPSDTLLPKMGLGYDSISGKKNFLISWRSEHDPSPGLFLAGLSVELPPQLYVLKNGSTSPHWRSGPWDTSKFVGVPTMNSLAVNPFSLDYNVANGTRYFSYSFDKIPGDTVLAYMDISTEGRMSFMFSEGGSNWDPQWFSSENLCDDYGTCGPFGVCKASGSPICKCLKGFVPKSKEEWSKGKWTGGCVRRTSLSCETNTNGSVTTVGKDDGFSKLTRMKVPDSHKFLTTLDTGKFEECTTQCLSNCSCLAYAYVDGIGCLVWYEELIDMQRFPSFGDDLYVRLAHSELDGGKPIGLIASLSAIGSLTILVAIVFCLHRWFAKKNRHLHPKSPPLESTSMLKNHRDGLREYIGKHDPSELKIYDFDSILVATNNFSFANKLGEGGFGPVYKGMLPEGKQIAVKRLSSSSGQGVEEFKNEMLLISNLQHKNLVRMMGCCVHEDEKLLVYEFMPNKSLDTFLFDPTKRSVLDWGTCFNIIQGIARGLLYLHHDSYVKVIHRDLKTSNILLDEKMNPKISDFGLARIVEETKDLDNTVKVVGTRGYMSPEYAMGGVFSEKSDVYSFGVLVLEIISGKKNNSFYLYDQHLGFLAYAWMLWNEGSGLEFVSDALDGSYSSYEVLKCMQIGLLCVQDSASDRPTMTEVAFMLSSETEGPQPKRPVFTIENSLVPSHHPHYENTKSSSNEATITVIEGR